MKTFVWVSIILLACSCTAHALTISRTLYAGPGGDLLATGNWNSSDTSLFYEVTDSPPGLWTYRYVLTIPDAKKTPGISNFELEVSDNLTAADLESVLPGYDELGDLKANPGNKGLAEGIYGIKFETGDVVSYEFEIVTHRLPMWVDFGAKGGQEYVRNTGFTVNDQDPQVPYTASVLDHILGPDTQTGNQEPPIPEPMTLLGVVLAAGTAGTYLKRRLR